MAILGTPPEKGIQLYIRDDGNFQFRDFSIEQSHLVEKDNRDNVKNAWLMAFKLLKSFDGLQGVSKAGKVTVSYSRDTIYDPYHQLNPGEGPEKGKGLVQDFTANIATSKCYKHEHSHKQTFIMDKITIFCGCTALLLGIAIAVQQAVG